MTGTGSPIQLNALLATAGPGGDKPGSKLQAAGSGRQEDALSFDAILLGSLGMISVAQPNATPATAEGSADVPTPAAWSRTEGKEPHLPASGEAEQSASGSGAPRTARWARPGKLAVGSSPAVPDAVRKGLRAPGVETSEKPAKIGGLNLQRALAWLARMGAGKTDAATAQADPESAASPGTSPADQPAASAVRTAAKDAPGPSTDKPAAHGPASGPDNLHLQRPDAMHLSGIGTAGGEIAGKGGSDSGEAIEDPVLEALTAQLAHAQAGSGRHAQAGGTAETVHLPETPKLIQAQVVEQILQQGLSKAGAEVGRERLTLQLDPPHLGRVEVQLKGDGDNLTLVFKAESSEAEAALRKGSEQLSQIIVKQTGRWSNVEIRYERGSQEDRQQRSPDQHDGQRRQPSHDRQQRRPQR